MGREKSGNLRVLRLPQWGLGTLLFCLSASVLLAAKNPEQKEEALPGENQLWELHHRAGVETTPKFYFKPHPSVRLGLEKNVVHHDFIPAGLRLHIKFTSQFGGLPLGKSTPMEFFNEYVVKRLQLVLDSNNQNAHSLIWSFKILSLGLNFRRSAGGIAPFGGHDFSANKPKQWFGFAEYDMGRFYIRNHGDGYAVGYRFSLGRDLNLALQTQQKSDREKLYALNGVDYPRVSLHLTSRW